MNGEPGFEQRRAERIPGVYSLVGKHHRQHTIGYQDAVRFLEGQCQELFVVCVSQLDGRLGTRRALPATRVGGHFSEQGGVGDRLGLLVGESLGAQVWPGCSKRAFQPDVEEV
jgi:hypothetical protein